MCLLNVDCGTGDAMRSLLKSKKGQLFIIEAFIAVSVMNIMVTALYEVQIATQPAVEPNFGKEVYDTLKLLDQDGQLDEYIFALITGSSSEIIAAKNGLSQAIYLSLPANGEFSLYCENLTSSSIIAGGGINQQLTPPKETIGLDYIIMEVLGTYNPCLFRFQIWLIGV